jgi:hypothetical protein
VTAGWEYTVIAFGDHGQAFRELRAATREGWRLFDAAVGEPSLLMLRRGYPAEPVATNPVVLPADAPIP